PGQLIASTPCNWLEWRPPQERGAAVPRPKAQTPIHAPAAGLWTSISPSGETCGSTHRRSKAYCRGSMVKLSGKQDRGSGSFYTGFCMLTIIYLIAITAEAMSGALTAGRSNMDMFGVAFIAFLTALGGGTVRDILLGNYPVTWTQHSMYIYLVISAGRSE